MTEDDLPLTEGTPPYRVDLSGMPLPPPREGAVQVGDILKTRQGKLYLVLALPGPTRGWRTSEFIQHVALNADGTWGRLSQTILSYVEDNYLRVGRVSIVVGDPEWF